MTGCTQSPRVVAVLMGGTSVEREVSLSSGRECAQALRLAGYEVIEIDAGPDLATQLPQYVGSIDVVFNALHGRGGEDGLVQGLMELLGLKYTHSGVLASALAMDKTMAKRVLTAAGLPLPAGQLAAAADVRTGHIMSPPYVVKPNDEGSSLGIWLVHQGDGPPALDETMPETVLVEAYIAGRELTCAVMGDRALDVTEMTTADGWYDYNAKYVPGGSQHILPAQIPDEITAACKRMALAAHNALGCRGLTRTDFRWDDRAGLDGLYILEINTQPGMTPTSLAPEQAAAAGYDFPALCRWLVEDAL